MSITEIAISIACILLLSIFIQSLLVAGFVHKLKSGLKPRNSPVDKASQWQPKTAVILCLRGGDPSLSDCLNGLSQLRYPDWVLHLILDSPQDPAKPIVEAWLSGPRQNLTYQIHYLENPLSTCSLKCSSLIQVVASLPDDYGAIAQVDADTVVHPDWLNQLVDSMADPKYGAATGNRWYMPDHFSWGAMVRYCWNSAAVVQMYWYNIAWGGSIAVKMTAIRKADLLAKWGQGLCEDTMLFRELRKHDLKLAFASNVMMVNREDSGLASYIRWGARQLMTVRLHHPMWLAVVGHGISTTVFVGAAILGLVIAISLKQWDAMLYFAIGFGFYQSMLIVLAFILESSVRKVLQKQGNRTNAITASSVIWFLGSMLLTQVVYPVVLIRAMLARQTEWRGINYNLHSNGRIEMLAYAPYVQTVEPGAPPAMSL